jgi:NTE family protein
MASPQVPAGRGGAAFVLGGGGVLGAAEVGMLQALFEDQVRPDLIVGTSVGAINGALVAADPAPSAVDQLRAVWEELASRHIFGGSVLGRMSTMVRTRTQVHPPEPLRHLLEAHLPVQTFAEQQVPFHCVAASIERAAERWFTEGALVDAVLGSYAVPGLLPPVAFEGEHYLAQAWCTASRSAGRSRSVPTPSTCCTSVGSTVRCARRPGPGRSRRSPLSIARRHRFAAGLAALPPGVTVHVLPPGDPAPPGTANLRYRDFSGVAARINRAHGAARGYLDRVGAPQDGSV